MAGLFSIFSGGNERANKPAYSIDHLQNLYNKLQHIKGAADTHSRDAMVEVIRQITEALLWGEQNDHDQHFFLFFCEKNLLADFVRVLGLPQVPKTVKVQLLQTLSMLVQNIGKEQSLYYLFSNNYINHIIAAQVDWSDEEILGYYISFLKSLALRLNCDTIKFFFNERTGQFPLYIEAIRFFGHRDQMVRTSVRTLTLQVFSVQDAAMQKFVLERSSRTYFVHLSCYLRELWVELNNAALRAANGAEQPAAALQDMNEQHQDFLMYLSDILELPDHPALAEALAERLLHYAVLPVILGSLIAWQSGEPNAATPVSPLSAPQLGLGAAAPDADGVRQDLLLSPAVALFVLHQIFENFRSRSLLAPLATALLSSAVPSALAASCRASPRQPPATYRQTSADVSGPASMDDHNGTGKEAIEVDEAAWIDGSHDAATDTAKVRTATSPRNSTSETEENAVRPLFLALLHGQVGCQGIGAEDTCLLLAAGTLGACLARRMALPEDFLVQTCILPPLGNRHEGEELLVSVARVLVERHQQLRVVVVQALSRLVLELASAPSLTPGTPNAQNPSSNGILGAGPTALEAVHLAVSSAATHVRSYLTEDMGDALLDIFAEELEHNRMVPLQSLAEACRSVRCLLPAPPSANTTAASETWCWPEPHEERQFAAKAVRCLLVLRRMDLDLKQRRRNAPSIGEAARGEAPSSTSESVGALAVPAMPSPPPPPPPPPLDAGTQEASLLRLPEEAQDGHEEGKAFALGRQDRIVCGVVAAEGRQCVTRYLVLHPFLLLLVQPDLVSPGWAVVKTLCPMRQVEPLVIDGRNPRTLRLCIRLAKGSPCPGEASEFDPAADPSLRLSQEEHRNSSFFLLELSFKDLNRCHHASLHIRQRRQEVRAQVQKRLGAFIDEMCE